MMVSRRVMRRERIRANKLYRSLRMPSVWNHLSYFDRWIVWDRLQVVGSPAADRINSEKYLGPMKNILFKFKYVVKTKR